MPELPEVETLRRDLTATLPGRVIVAVDARLPKILTKWGGLGGDALVGRRIERLGRRAKILRVHLDQELTMLVHLKLSGQLIHRGADGHNHAAGGHPTPAYDAPMPHKSTHIIFSLDDGSTLYFTDIRQFGRVAVLADADADAMLAAMKHGPEPFDESLNLEVFRSRLARRAKSPIKNVLLDQSFVAGLGNIYANEALGEARLAPTRLAGALTDDETARLFDQIRAVLRRALTEGVADLTRNGVAGDRDFPRFHGRAELPCYVCGGSISRTMLNGRSCYWCPACQV